ncbi:acyltransferase family protein [Rugosimonospora acidiphila]
MADRAAAVPRPRRPADGQTVPPPVGQPIRPDDGQTTTHTTGFRADIEGLRAVAVLLVVLYHLTGYPSGGFIGVDVFFVISGFLITGLLVRETEQRGRLSFRGFYARRVRRILPGALAVLAAVTVTAHVVFRGARIAQTVDDVRWALAFAANVHFARIGADYFQADRAPSPVQHFWSLAVEEQFYLVWPVVILVVLSLVARRLTAPRARALLLVVVALAGAASFAYSVVHTRDAATAAYFSSPARAWELGAGAALAVAIGPVRRLATRLGRARGPLWLLGLAGVAASGFVTPAGPGFPAPWAALAVGSAAVLLAAGAAGPLGRWGAPLTNPVARYLGRVSYSLYLWHWPVVVVTAVLIPDAPEYRYPIAVLAMLGLSVASYHLVEAPCRRLGSRRARHPGGWRFRLAGVRRPAIAAAACLCCVAVLGALVPPRTTPGLPATRASRLLPLPAEDLAPAPASLTSAIDASLSATGFPAVTPGLDQQGTARVHWGGCSVPGPSEVAGCTFGSTADDAPVAVVMGDSMAMSWLPGIEAALNGGRSGSSGASRAEPHRSDWRVVGLTLESCPAADVSVYDTNGRHDDDCDAHHAWAVAEAAALHPRLVVLSETEDTLGRLASGATGTDATTQYEVALRDTIARLGPGAGRHVVTLAPPPKAGALTDCDNAGGIPADCVRPISNEWVTLASAERSVARSTGTSYVDTRTWFCDGAGLCPSFVGTTAVRWDTEHLTDVYARSLAAPLRGVLLTGGPAQ